MSRGKTDDEQQQVENAPNENASLVANLCQNKTMPKTNISYFQRSNTAAANV